MLFHPCLSMIFFASRYKYRENIRATLESSFLSVPWTRIRNGYIASGKSFRILRFRGQINPSISVRQSPFREGDREVGDRVRCDRRSSASSWAPHIFDFIHISISVAHFSEYLMAVDDLGRFVHSLPSHFSRYTQTSGWIRLNMLDKEDNND